MRASRPAISYAIQVQVFREARWLCAWCHAPLVFAPALNLLDRWARMNGSGEPLAYFHPRWRRDASPLLDYLGAVVDHVAAFSTGGAHDKSNFVASCNKCNSLKSASRVEALIEKRRPRRVKGRYGEPNLWDGFTTLFVLLAAQHPDWLSTTDRKWLLALTAKKAASPTAT